MPSRMTCQVVDDHATTVVRVSGFLDLTTTQALHNTLRDCLAAQPSALVVDASGLTVATPLALSVFAAVTRQAEIWPVAPVLICGLDEPTVDWLSTSTVCSRLAVRRSCREALRETRGQAVPRVRARLQPVADACRRARDLVTEVCRGWQLPEVVEPARLVVSELVANAVRHARTPVEVTLALRRPYLHIAVADGSRARTEAGEPDAGREGGRGLLLVREMAQRWGSLPAGQGKVVWALLAAR